MLNALKELPLYYRAPRHLRSLFQHSSIKKFNNLLLVEYERRRRAVKVTGRPYIIYADPGNVCNLKCPLCPGGNGRQGMKKQLLSFSKYKRFLEPLNDYLYQVFLYNWGEPFLNPEIFDMIEHNRRKNIGTNISTNLSVKRNSLVNDIIDSGLEYLSVSLDGAVASTYGKYRVNGDFDLVLENLKALIATKRALKKRHPIIEWQYIVMRHNEGEAAEAAEMAKKIGVDLIRFIPVRLIPEDTEENRKEMVRDWFPEGKKWRRFVFDEFRQDGEYLHNKGCFHLYRSLAINPDGTILPCNIIYKHEDNFGSLAEIAFEDIWNNDSYRSARNLFSNRNHQSQEGTVACQRCRIFRKSEQAKGTVV